MRLSNDAILLVDWLNLSIHLKRLGLSFGSKVVHAVVDIAAEEARLSQASLARAHFVAESFSDAAARAIDQNLIARKHVTRTAKEQADLQLAVLAMEHIFSSDGAPRLFVLCTGDQDFVPLVDRMIEARSNVVLVVASRDYLAPEYRAIVARQDIKVISLADDVSLQATTGTPSDRAVRVGSLLKLIWDGSILGGDQSRNAKRLVELGLIESSMDAEEVISRWIRDVGREESRRVAVPARSEVGNHAQTQRRTAIDFNSAETIRIFEDFDWLLRRCSSAPSHLGDLGVGRFAQDDGARVRTLVETLERVGWLVARPDNRYEAKLEWAADGLLEPIGRLVMETARLSHDRAAIGVRRQEIFDALRSGPLASDQSRRGGRAASDLISLGRRIGVIDTFSDSRDGYLLGLVDTSGLSRRVQATVRALVRLMSGRGPLGEHELLELMRERDAGLSQPLFGYDSRDRRSWLRAMRRASLIKLDSGSEPRYSLRDCSWVTKLK